ncbi:MAG TPA: PfkB family carbohydrate kinase [Geminicoccus sp.]|jgi:sulfofructose kinase|uniref:PfkB family carbohydrate kinase n=1 Tax=Geminicoccus sp. TaxID=2024832 RepID=UPI002E2EF6A0|nr:PfkB family carbohydrate kinase [Geminicoccus sp.]HEX2525718.1 PfkB family carbohydrate kinase [Geminicoccus sp.]
MTALLCVGVLVLDVIFLVDELPSGGEKMLGHGMSEAIGGPAAIGGLAAVRLGGKASLLSRVGDDRVGKAILDGFRDAGLDTSAVEILPGATSSFSAVAVDPNGERQIVNYTDPRLHAAAPRVIPPVEPFDAVLVDTIYPMAAIPALKAARQHGLPGIVDFDVKPRSGSSEILELASHIAFSRQGLRSLTGLDDAEAGLRAVASRNSGWVGVTLGENGIMWLENGAIRQLPAFQVDVVDTLGAGDVFHGGLAYGLAQGRSIEDALHLGAAAAAVKCTRKGGGPGAPTRAEVDSFLRARGAA